MDEIARQLFTTLLAMWRWRWAAMLVAWLVTAVGMLGVFIMRDRYEATAQVFVDTQTVLKPLMNGLAFQPDIDAQVRMLAKTLINRPNVERLIALPRLGLDHLSASDREKVIDRLVKDIKVLPAGNANLYTISYRDGNPARANALVDELVGLFMRQGISGKQRDSVEARVFLDAQIKDYEVKLSDAENRLKDFKIKNFGLTGSSNEDFFARMSSASDEINRLRVELQAAEQARDALRRELAQEDPTMPREALASGMGGGQTDAENRLEALRRQLDELLRRYTDEHPDVIAVRRNLAQAERDRRTERETQLKEAQARGRAAPTSPVFQRIRVALAESEARVASLRGQLGAKQAQLEQTRAMASRTPQVEADLAQLNRDYDIVRKNYSQLVERRESASLGEKIDQTTQIAEFRLIEPPRTSPKPVAPSRMMVALLGFVGALASACLTAFGMSQLLPSIFDSQKLNTLTGRPVLGTVAMVLTPTLRGQFARQQRLFVWLLIGLVVVNMGWLLVVKQQLLP